MKARIAAVLALVVHTASGALVNDPFTDASHTNTSGGDAQGAVWFRNATSGSTLAVVDDVSVSPSSKALSLTATASARGMLAFFTPQTLATGQMMIVEFDFRFTTAPANGGQSFLFGLYDSAGTRQTADASSTTRLDDRGYGLVTNVGADTTNATRVFVERAGDDILGGSGVVFPSGSVNGASFACGTAARHHARLTVTRQANGSVLLQGCIDAGTTASVTVTTVTDEFYTFDMLALSNGTVIESFLIDNVSVKVPVPPTVAITSPATDTVLVSPAVLTITANATDNGSVAKVEFFRGTTKLGEDSAAPFTFDWVSPGPGVHTLTAVATDDDGDTATSAPVDIRVTGGAADEFDTLRLRWFDIFTGGNAHDLSDPDIAARVSGINGTAQANWNSMDKSAGRTTLWSDLATPTYGLHISGSFARLSGMAQAYVTNGCALKGNAALLADILSALDWMNANRYSDTTVSAASEWFAMEILAPQYINNICAMLYDSLSPGQLMRQMRAIEHFSPDPTVQQLGGSPAHGSNRADKCHITTVRGILVKDAAKLVLARDVIGQVFATVTSGDGFYADGSFVFHTGLAATATYGIELLVSLNRTFQLTDNSTWVITDPNRANVFGWVTKGYEPFMFRGAMMDMVAGRDISRSGSTDHIKGHEFLAAMIDTATYASPADALTFRRIAKAHINADTSRNFIANASLPTLIRIKPVLADASITPQPELVVNRQFAGSARAVHQRPGFAFGISMSSNRIFNYEAISSENYQGWHTGDGAAYLYNSDLDEYSNAYWPTVNRKRLAGTTVDTQTLANNADQSTFGTFAWAGGAELLGLYGVTGMELDARSSTLTARKSWFAFDNEIVALGSGITSTDNRTIETIVENRRLNDPASALTVDGVAKPATLGWSETMSGIGWAHLAATGGIIFHGGATVKGLREARNGAWSEINAAGSSAIITRNYATLWLDHGANPTNATYAYTQLPGASAAQTSAYAANPDIIILANTAAIHAVREQSLGITAANFWNDGTSTAGLITTDKKCSVLVRETTTQLDVALSDPTQLGGIVTIELARSAVALTSADPAITVWQLSPTIRFTANVSGALGRTLTATFQDTPFNAWQHAHFATNLALSAASLDPDNDGATNLLEFATGTDPLADSSAQRPVQSIASVAGTNYLALTFRRRTGASAVSIIVEATSDLITGPWLPDPVQFGVAVDNADGTETVTFRDIIPLGTVPLRLMRLKVTVP